MTIHARLNPSTRCVIASGRRVSQPERPWIMWEVWTRNAAVLLPGSWHRPRTAGGPS